MEIKVEKGRGYVPVENREAEKLEVGMIAVDALYSPIQRVRYNVENTRVGQMTDLDRLVMEIETDGSELSDKAIEAGIEFAREAQAQVTGFTAVPEYPLPSEAELMARRVLSLDEYERQAKRKAQTKHFQ